MARDITTNEELPIHIIPRDSKGNVARVDGPPVWTVSDETVIELAPGADEFGKVVRPKGPVGAALVTCTVDADLGEGVRHLTGQLTVTVLPGEAATLAINAGEATPITPAPAPAVEEQPAADPVPTDTSASEATTEVTTDPAVAEVVADPVTEEAPAEPAPRPAGEMRTEQQAAAPVAEETQPAAEAGQEDGDTSAG